MVDLKTSSATLEAIELMYFAYRAFTEPPDRVLAERGLGRVHHRILYFVGRSPGLSVGELVDTLRVTKQALNAPLRQLMEMGLVSAEVAVHDRRVRRLSLSPEGLRLERRLTATQARQLSRIFESVGEPAAEAWRAVMRGLAAGRPGATS